MTGPAGPRPPAPTWSGQVPWDDPAEADACLAALGGLVADAAADLRPEQLHLLLNALRHARADLGREVTVGLTAGRDRVRWYGQLLAYTEVAQAAATRAAREDLVARAQDEREQRAADAIAARALVRVRSRTGRPVSQAVRDLAAEAPGRPARVAGGARSRRFPG